jgi:hypothetical protein
MDRKRGLSGGWSPKKRELSSQRVSSQRVVTSLNSFMLLISLQAIKHIKVQVGEVMTAAMEPNIDWLEVHAHIEEDEWETVCKSGWSAGE